MFERKKFPKISMRTKAAFLIVVIVLIVSAINFASSMFFTQRGLINTMEKNMVLARDIADSLVTTTIDLLKSDALTVAERLSAASDPDEMIEIMKNQLDIYKEFMAFTVFDAKGIIAEFGYAPTPLKRLYASRYLSSAFKGEAAISTTRIDQDTGELVLHVCVPMQGGRILSVTIPGLTFSNLLDDFRFYNSGNLFLVDEEGTMIANYRHNLVLSRINYIDLARSDRRWETTGALLERTIEEKEGFGQYYYEGVDRICAFTRVTGSSEGWSLGVTAPLPDSPAADVERGLVLSNLCLLFAGIVLSFFLARPMARPYEKVAEQKKNLEDLRQVAESASEAKSSFLANMSHEMRTPLNAIIGLSELSLGATGMDSDSRQNVEKVHYAGMTLLGIVNDILDLSKIESGKFEIINDTYEIASLINDTVTVNRVRIGSKPITFVLDVSPELPDKLYGDELRIKQTLNNLLSNAFKYTKEGSVTWKIYGERNEKGFWLISEISDTGIGIKQEDVTKLFSNYNQVDRKSNRKIEGTGLGLSITKSLAQMMDGDVLVRSIYGKGSVFTLRIRQGEVGGLAIGDTVAKNLENFGFNESKRARNEKLVRIRMPYARVLVVDDVATNLDVAKGILKPYGIQVDCVMSGQEAVDLVKTEPGRYDAIFMDHMMPEMDGIEATQIIRNEIGTEYAKTIPILALTANALVGNEEMFLKNGFQAFLSKPIDIIAMDAVIRKWVRNKSKEAAYEQETGKALSDRRNHVERRAQNERRSGDDRRDLHAAGETNGLASPEPDDVCGLRGADRLILHSGPARLDLEGLDVEQGLGHFGGDRTIYLEVLQSYAKNTPGLLVKLEGFAENSLADYAITVHGIKSSSLSIGAALVGEQAAALEKAAKEKNVDFVKAENGRFMQNAETLLAHIGAFLEGLLDDEGQKPLVAEPDTETLEKLKDACMNFDIDGVDETIAALKAFRYESGGDLVEWLENHVAQMKFREIIERLVH